MKKLILAVFISMLSTSVVFASTFTAPITATDSTTITVGSDGTVYTETIDTRGRDLYAVSFKTSSPTTGVGSDNTIVVQQSYQKPTTEETDDSAWNIVQSSDVTTTVLSGTTSGSWYHQSLTLAPLPWTRFKITSSSQGADNTVEMKITKKRI